MPIIIMAAKPFAAAMVEERVTTGSGIFTWMSVRISISRYVTKGTEVKRRLRIALIPIRSPFSPPMAAEAMV